MQDGILEVVKNAQTPMGGFFVVSVLILVAYITIIFKTDKDGPFGENFLLITALCITIPAILLLAVTKAIATEAVTALLGAIVGSLFQNKLSTGRSAGPTGDRD